MTKKIVFFSALFFVSQGHAIAENALAVSVDEVPVTEGAAAAPNGHEADADTHSDDAPNAPGNQNNEPPRERRLLFTLAKGTKLYVSEANHTMASLSLQSGKASPYYEYEHGVGRPEVDTHEVSFCDLNVYFSDPSQAAALQKQIDAGGLSLLVSKIDIGHIVNLVPKDGRFSKARIMCWQNPLSDTYNNPKTTMDLVRETSGSLIATREISEKAADEIVKKNTLEQAEIAAQREAARAAAPAVIQPAAQRPAVRSVSFKCEPPPGSSCGARVYEITEYMDGLIEKRAKTGPYPCAISIVPGACVQEANRLYHESLRDSR